MGKIEQIMEILTASRKSGRKEEEVVLDERSFSDIVDHVMPKEVCVSLTTALYNPAQDIQIIYSAQVFQFTFSLPLTDSSAVHEADPADTGYTREGAV